jgi:hypothetical protein
MHLDGAGSTGVVRTVGVCRVRDMSESDRKVGDWPSLAPTGANPVVRNHPVSDAMEEPHHSSVCAAIRIALVIGPEKRA